MIRWLTFSLILLAGSETFAGTCFDCGTIRSKGMPRNLDLNQPYSTINEDFETEGAFQTIAGGDVVLLNVPATNSMPDRRQMTQSTAQCQNGQGTHKQMCETFNAFRRVNRLPELTMDSRLNQIAQAYAEKMAATGRFDHVDEQGGPDARVSRAGVAWRGVAENIAQGQVSIEEVFTDWYKSPGHKQNMVSPNFNKHGFGYAKGYWVHVFVLE